MCVYTNRCIAIQFHKIAAAAPLDMVESFEKAMGSKHNGFFSLGIFFLCVLVSWKFGLQVNSINYSRPWLHDRFDSLSRFNPCPVENIYHELRKKLTLFAFAWLCLVAIWPIMIAAMLREWSRRKYHWIRWAECKRTKLVATGQLNEMKIAKEITFTDPIPIDTLIDKHTHAHAHTLETTPFFLILENFQTLSMEMNAITILSKDEQKNMKHQKFTEKKISRNIPKFPTKKKMNAKFVLKKTKNDIELFFFVYISWWKNSYLIEIKNLQRINSR